MPLDPAHFKRALAQFASGVTVVTTRTAEGQPLGLTVTAFCSVSLEPPLVLVSIDNRSEAHEGFRDWGYYGVSLLAENQEAISKRFASGGPGKFEESDLVSGPHGTLLVSGALAHIECRVVSAFPGGDHTLYVGEVLEVDVTPGRPLVYQAGRYRWLEDAGAGGRDRV